MKWYSLLLMLVVLCGLAGCEETAMERQADSVRNSSQNQADQIRDESQRKADEIRDRADQKSSQAEDQADAIESAGEQHADDIEEKGEEIADDMEAVDNYWRDRYKTRPYYTTGDEYTKYRDAYAFGYRSRNKYPDREWDDVSTDLQTEWEKTKADARSTWENMKDAIRDAWDADYPDR